MQLYLLRHGESTYNEYYTTTGCDPMFFDAPLTSRGVVQSIHARDLLMSSDINLIVTSPLRRAIDTLMLAAPFEDHPHSTFEVWPEVTEQVEASCDIGTHASTLAVHYPNLHFSMPDVWWYAPEEAYENTRNYFKQFGILEPQTHVMCRVQNTLRRLETHPNSNILIVGHADFFNLLCAELGYNDVWMGNGEVFIIKD